MKTIFKAAFAVLALTGATVAGAGVTLAQGYDGYYGNGYYDDGRYHHRYYYDSYGVRHGVTYRDYEPRGSYTHRGQDYPGYHYYPNSSPQGRSWCYYYPEARGCRAL